MLGKNKQSAKIADAVGKSADFELTIADMARRSERRAWWITSTSIVLTLVLASGYFVMLPLKREVPYLVMADAYTGTSTVAKLRWDFPETSILASEAINRSNISHYIMAREAYDADMLALRDWRTVNTMSEQSIANEFRSRFSSVNPDNPATLYGKEKSVRVKINSIILQGKEGQKIPDSATVRFQRLLYDKRNGQTQPLDSRIATMRFTYQENLKMSDRDRVENPLGFRVTAYRLDNDYETPAPAEVPVAAPVASVPTAVDTASMTDTGGAYPPVPDAAAQVALPQQAALPQQQAATGAGMEQQGQAQ